MRLHRFNVEKVTLGLATHTVLKAYAFIATLALFSAAMPIFAQAGQVSLSQMQDSYLQFRRHRESDDNQLPFQLDSELSSRKSRAHIGYLLEGVDFQTFVNRLSQPAEWCEFIPLHLNIKACGYFQQGGRTLVQFYAGIKGYITPDDAHLLQLSFDTAQDDGVFTARLFAADGPLDSTNISFDIQAIEVDDLENPGIYIRFTLSSEPGVANSLARIYLATIGRKKIGFSTEGTRFNGKPRYVRGQRGAIERNIVRYLLAIETYFATLDLAGESIYQNRLERWYDATDRYRAQLFELERGEYLENKVRERANQDILQQSLAENVEPVYKPIDRRR